MASKNDVAPCGIYCPGCRVYKASENRELAEKIAENMQISVEDVQCDGCKAEEGDISVMPIDGKCDTYICAEEKSLDFCLDCNDYPCYRLYSYRNSPPPHNSKINNLTIINEKGLDWFLENAEKLTEMYYKGEKEYGGSKLKVKD